MSTNDRWSALSMKDKADLIKLMVENGVTSLDDMRLYYNGGEKEGKKQKAIISNKDKEKTYSTPQNASFIKDLAYRIGANKQVSGRGYAGPEKIASALLHLDKDLPFDDNKYAFLYGTGRRFPVVEEPIQGFDFTKYVNNNYSKSKASKIKNVYGIINPDEEYYIDDKYRGLVEELAKHNYHFYDNADDLAVDMDVDNTKAGYRDDVGSFVHQFGLDEGGNPVVHDADVYDFLPKDYNYGDDSALIRTLVKAEAGLFNSVGTPYIIRQEWQPIIFGDTSRFSNNINKHLEEMTEEDIAKATGTGFIEPVYITDGGAPIIIKTTKEDYQNKRSLGGNLYKKGGSIHINPENKGKFTATKKRTGKTTEELTHSKNPLTRKRAIFAQNAKKWHHAEGGPLGDKDTLSHPKYNAASEEAMYNYLSNNGLNDAQAAGIMGNLAVESLLNSTINQFNGPAYGLIQAEGARKKALKSYQGNPYVFGSGLLPEEQKQLDYIIDVGINNYTPGEWGKQGYSGARAARKAFIDSSDVNEASDIFMKNYLRPGKPHQERRRKMSNYYFDKYGHNDFIFDDGEWVLQNILKK